MNSGTDFRLNCALAACFVLRTRGANVETLLLKRASRVLEGRWTQVSGSIEPGESAWQAALRELHEETGLVPLAFYSSDSHEQFYEADRNVMTIAPVFVAMVATDAQVRLNHEHTDYVWCTPVEADKLLSFGGQRRILRQIIEDFVMRVPDPHLRITLQ
ncbi:MAG: hypothetical protein RL341_2305 [Pseudomonadota bacterium]|jgi:dATP pyrophosphohydrolase